MEVWKNVMKRTFLSVGLHQNDIIRTLSAWALRAVWEHTTGPGFGATVVPTSGSTDRQIMVMRDFGHGHAPRRAISFISSRPLKTWDWTCARFRCGLASLGPALDGTYAPL